MLEKIVPEVSGPSDVQTGALKELEKITDAFLKLTTKYAEMAGRGPSVFLPAFGAALLTVALVIRLLPLSTLAPSEFIALVVVSAGFLGAGSWFRWYEFRTQRQVNDHLRNIGGDIIHELRGMGEKLASAGQDERVNL